MNNFLLLFIINLVVVINCSTDTVSKKWEEFKNYHRKVYSTNEEESQRMSIFKTNFNKIQEHNNKYALNEVPFKLGINKFADLTSQEYSKIYNGVVVKKTSNNIPIFESLPQALPLTANITVPSTMDWRSLGAVTNVKNQLKCGSCWAFSSTGALEGQLYRKTGKLIGLSEQNLIDCSQLFGNLGCSGGLMNYAFQYVKYNKGIDIDSAYYYEGTNTNCRYNASRSAGTITGYVDIEPNNELKLQQAVANIGPIAIAIDASLDTFQFYESGVYKDSACNSEYINHGVLVVGYGSNGTDKDFWIVKNSWGTEWGEQGYVRIARNKNNTCGVATMASYPTV